MHEFYLDTSTNDPFYQCNLIIQFYSEIAAKYTLLCVVQGHPSSPSVYQAC